MPKHYNNSNDSDAIVLPLLGKIHFGSFFRFQVPLSPHTFMAGSIVIKPGSQIYLALDPTWVNDSFTDAFATSGGEPQSTNAT